MTDDPKISVCIPVFNTERFVGQAVASALAQTMEDFEVVVVDNASTDRTPEILSGFRDPRIRVFRNDQNIGAAGNFNRALSLARGRYIKVLCADDVVYPACLEKQAAVLDGDARGDIAVVCCARDVIDERGRPRLRRGFPGPSGRIDGRRATMTTVRSGTNVFGEPAAIMVRADAVRAAGGFDARYNYCIDLDLWCRLLVRGDLYVIDEKLCAFRLSSQSWSAALAGRQHTEFARLIDELAADRGLRLSWFDRKLGRMRARANAVLRQGVTRMVLFGSRR